MREKMRKNISKRYRLFLALLTLIIGIGITGCDESKLSLNESASDAVNVTMSDETPESSESLEDVEDIEIESTENEVVETDNTEKTTYSTVASTKNDNSFTIPKYNGKPYAVINKNVPYFKKSELKKTSYETYAKLDKLGRCGVARANVGRDIMPTEKRGAIGSVKPTGWKTVKYDIVDGKYLYNRCHLIGYQLTGENANMRNLITGTRYMNVDGMLPFENMVADFVKETGKHVLYQVKPIFKGNNLLATGVHMQAKSVEDNGKGISFNVFVFNVQPGIKINYANGESALQDGKVNNTKENKATKKPTQKPTNQPTKAPVNKDKSSGEKSTYILNTNTKKFHNTSCSSTKTISVANKKTYIGYRKDLINKGYDPCKRCNP